MEKRYITISEFGDVHMHKGEIPAEILSAANEGIYDVLDVTDPDCPLQYHLKGWINIDKLPVGPE